MVNEQLNTKDSIRLGQAMNIVGNRWANMTKAEVNWNCEAFSDEVLNLYDALTSIEKTVLREQNEEIEANKKPMGFPKKV